MAKKNKIKEDAITNYYDLKVKETDELVAILKGEQEKLDGETPTTDIYEITGEQVKGGKRAKNFNPYKRDKLSAIPFWIKALFIKWWFVGAVTYFIVFGFGASFAPLDMVIVVGIILGVVTDVLVNPIFFMMESDRHEYNAFIMFPFPFKKYWTFFANILYYIAVYIPVAYIYGAINKYWGNLPVEPVICGVFTLVIDMALIGIKDLAVLLVKNCGKKEKALDV